MPQSIPICTEDDPFLFQLYASTRAAEMQAWGWDPLMQQAFLTMQWAAQQRSYAMQFPDADHRIIIFQNVRIGRLFLSRTEQELRLVDLTLLPEYHNQGIGTQLLKELQAEAAESNKWLRLSVIRTNPARRLYERLGFTVTGENDLYDFMEWCAAMI